MGVKFIFLLADTFVACLHKFIHLAARIYADEIRVTIIQDFHIYV
jgi:hypothetical protein